ncbi:MAG: vWA domain-containing protein [Pseudomonadota bacterium]
MKKFVGAMCATALVLPGMGSAPMAQQPSSESVPERTSRDGYCRLPAALPDLGPETAQNQQRPGRGVSPRERRTEMALPPPAPAIAPAPPPPAEIASTDESSAIAVTGSRVSDSSFDSAAPVGTVTADEAPAATSLPRRPVPPLPGPPPRPQPQPQSGLLTAGEHDDLLNHELYADYIRKSSVGQQVRDLPKVDTSRLLTVEVRDGKGRAVPFEQIELRCSDGNSLKLRTVADGSAVFFPEHDRLSSEVWIRASGSQWRKVILSNEPGAQTVKIRSRDAAPQVRKLDLALVVDVTGSMSDELRYLQAELSSIVSDLKARHDQLDIRVGFTFYRDKGDAFVTRTFKLDGDIEKARGHIAAQRANGGGDYEEAMQDALIRAANQPWREDAVKTLLLVADAPPHNQDIPLTWTATEHLRNERVHIVPVGASGVADTAEYVMRAMAAITQSRYTFLTEDSGIGNPKAPPAIDCYLVTRLDQLLRRVIDSQLSGRRIEPEKNEVIRSVGQYDAGRCVLPPDFAQRSDPA